MRVNHWYKTEAEDTNSPYATVNHMQFFHINQKNLSCRLPTCCGAIVMHLLTHKTTWIPSCLLLLHPFYSSFSHPHFVNNMNFYSIQTTISFQYNTLKFSKDFWVSYLFYILNTKLAKKKSTSLRFLIKKKITIILFSFISSYRNLNILKVFHIFKRLQKLTKYLQLLKDSKNQWL